MKLVVDTNILFSYFWKNSITRELFLEKNLLLLYAPEFSLLEIKKYASLIKQKTKLTEKEFNECREQLVNYVTFVHENDYAPQFKQALTLAKDKDDIDFIALALNLNCHIWSYDKQFLQQSYIQVLGTKEVIEMVSFLKFKD